MPRTYFIRQAPFRRPWELGGSPGSSRSPLEAGVFPLVLKLRFKGLQMGTEKSMVASNPGARDSYGRISLTELFRLAPKVICPGCQLEMRLRLH